MNDNQHLAQISKRLKTSSAVVPALIFCAITLPFGCVGVLFGPEEYRPFFAFLATAPIIVTLLQIGFFTAFDRDRLQNEEHLERRLLLSRLNAELGDANSVVTIDQRSDPLTENPSLEGRSNV